jgi:hypothetical protein
MRARRHRAAAAWRPSPLLSTALAHAAKVTTRPSPCATDLPRGGLDQLGGPFLLTAERGEEDVGVGERRVPGRRRQRPIFLDQQRSLVQLTAEEVRPREHVERELELHQSARVTRKLLVGPDRRLGEMPRPAIRIGLGVSGPGERVVDRVALSKGGRPVGS